MRQPDLDVIVVGSGPNGLAAAVTLARAGLRVRVYERADQAGGGVSTRELTLPGFLHDVCSAVHPLAFESRFFREFGLARRVEFATPDLSFAQPLDHGRAALAYRDLDRTREGLGVDGAAYDALMRPLVERVEEVAEFTGSPLVRVPRGIRTPVTFGLRALEQGSRLWNARFREELAPALLTGVAAHTILPQPSLAAAAAGLALGTYAHARGWPIPIGGSQAITDAMIADLRAHGGELVLDHEVASLDELPPARVTMLDVTPRALVAIAGARMPSRYRRAMESFRYGGAVAKVDFALSEPVPWQNPAVREAGTVHVGGTRDEVAHSENEVNDGRLPERPYVLVSQPTLVDPSRAPAGRHTLWTYTHVPAGSAADRAEAVIRQIERYAPGFRDTIIGLHSAPPSTSSGTIPTTRAATSRPARPRSGSSSAGPSSAPSRGGRRCRASTSRRPRSPPAPACTASQGGTPR